MIRYNVFEFWEQFAYMYLSLKNSPTLHWNKTQTGMVTSWTNFLLFVIPFYVFNALKVFLLKGSIVVVIFRLYLSSLEELYINISVFNYLYVNTQKTGSGLVYIPKSMRSVTLELTFEFLLTIWMPRLGIVGIKNG